MLQAVSKPARSTTFALPCLAALAFLAAAGVGACHRDDTGARRSSAVEGETSSCAVMTAPTTAAACKPAGRTCSPVRAAECCSLACLCPVGAKKCTCG